MKVDADVGVVLAVLGVAQPGVDDAMTADERLPAVDDGDLAMVAVVQHADVAQSLFMKKHDSASGFFHPSQICLACVFGAFCVKQDTHLRARPSPLRQRVRHALTEHAFLPKKSFEMH